MVKISDHQRTRAGFLRNRADTGRRFLWLLHFILSIKFNRLKEKHFHFSFKSGNYSDGRFSFHWSESETEKSCHSFIIFLTMILKGYTWDCNRHGDTNPTVSIWLGEVNVFCRLVMFKTTLRELFMSIWQKTGGNFDKRWRMFTHLSFHSLYSVTESHRFSHCEQEKSQTEVWVTEETHLRLKTHRLRNTFITSPSSTYRKPVVISLHNHNWPQTDNVWSLKRETKTSHRDIFRCLSLTLQFPSEETKWSSKSSHLRNWN